MNVIELVTTRRALIEEIHAANDLPPEVYEEKQRAWRAAHEALESFGGLNLEGNCNIIAAALSSMRDPRWIRSCASLEVDRDADPPLVPGYDRAALVDRLAEEVQRHTSTFVDSLALGDEPALGLMRRAVDGRLQRSGMFSLDADLADFLERIHPGGKAGRAVAAQTRDRSREAWRKADERDRLLLSASLEDAGPLRLWMLPWRGLQALVHVVWVDVVKPALDLLQRRAPALVMGVAESVALVNARGLRVERVGSEQLVLRPHPLKPKGGQPVPVAEVQVAPAEIATVPAEVIDMAQRVRHLGSHLVLPFIEWAAETAQRQSLGTSGHAQSIERVGGWGAIAAEVLGREPTARERVTVRRIAWALSLTPIRWADGAMSSSVLNVNESAAVAGRGIGRSVIVITVFSRLLEHERFRSKRRIGPNATGDQWANLRLVPLIKPRTLRPLPRSNHATFGPQSVFARLLWAEFVRRDKELRDAGGIDLDAQTVRTLARKALLPDEMAPRVLRHLEAEGVIVVDGDRYAPADEGVRRFIVDGLASRERARTETIERRKGKRKGGR